MEFVNGKDDIPYLMENYKNVWNHQPVMEYPHNIYIYIWSYMVLTYLHFRILKFPLKNMQISSVFN